MTVHRVITLSSRIVDVADKPTKPVDPPKPVAGKITCTARGVLAQMMVGCAGETMVKCVDGDGFELWCGTRLVATTKEARS